MKRLVFLFALGSAVLCLHAQDTFSIVAVDTVTGEVGSAGASCIDETAIPGGAIIISDVLPGRGGIHTQSYWNATNQANAHNRMVEGMSPQEIIDWLQTHDAQNNPGVRQYGVVDFDSAGHSRSAGFTGANCMNYKNHIVGPNYSIQGNILLGQQILDSIAARFLRTEGSFAEKLMAALQGAKVVGADTRCTSNGTSSLSAFIRVARQNDTTGSFYCDLNVPSVPEGMEPIDSLQTLFDAWLGQTVGVREHPIGTAWFLYPNPANEFFMVGGQQSAVSSRQSAVGSQEPGTRNQEPGTSRRSAVGDGGIVKIEMCNLMGWKLLEIRLVNNIQELRADVAHIPDGLYLVVISLTDGTRSSCKLIIMHSH